MRLTEDYVIYWLFLQGYSFATLGTLLQSHRYVDMDDDFCRREAEDAVRRVVNERRQHKRAR